MLFKKLLPLILYVILSPTTELFAQEISIDQIKEDSSAEWGDYEPIVVTAKRVPTPERGLAENVVVFTEEDILELPAQDLAEVLSYMPGIDVQLNGQFGQATALSINGSASRQVLLMVDGIPFNTQLSGQANPTQIPLVHIKQVELIKGASSSAWGSSLGGVVNIITKDVGDSAIPTGRVMGSYGD